MQAKFRSLEKHFSEHCINQFKENKSFLMNSNMILTKTVIIHQKSFTNLSSQLLLLLICQCLPCLFKARLLLTAATSKTNIKLKVTGGFNLSKGDLTLGKKSKTLILLLHCFSQRKKKCKYQKPIPSYQLSKPDQLSIPHCSANPCNEYDGKFFALLFFCIYGSRILGKQCKWPSQRELDSFFLLGHLFNRRSQRSMSQLLVKCWWRGMDADCIPDTAIQLN